MTDLDVYLARFFEAGGTITHIEENACTIDWSRDARTYRVARAMSRLGHARRRRLKACQAKQMAGVTSL